MANDYVNLEWDEFSETTWRTTYFRATSMSDLEENRDHREVWKGVPLGKRRKSSVFVMVEAGEYFDSRVTIGHHALPETAPPWLTIRFMRVQLVLTHLLHSSLSAVKHSSVVSDSVRWRFGHSKLMVLHTHFRKSLLLSRTMLLDVLRHTKLLLRVLTFLNRVFRNHLRYCLKELQSLGLDVRVLKDDNTEVEIMETIDYGATDLNSVMEGDRNFNEEKKPLLISVIPNRNLTVKVKKL